VAALAVDCTLLACSFTGAGSSDPDGTVARYAWAFGDGATATGATASHTYAAAGTYEATLTVTDDQGATATARRTVTVSAQQAQIAFRAGAGTDTNATTATVTVPAGVVAGDALLLFATVNDTVPSVGAPSGVTGWQQVAAKPGSTMQSVLWRKAAAAGDAGKAVTVSLSSIAKVSLQLVAYSGTAAAPVAAHAVATETQSTASHTTPTASVTQAGSWVVSYWADKSSATTSWTVPAGTSSRSTTVGTGSGRITSVVADSGAGVQPGTAGGLTAVANSASAKAVAWTVVLAPGA
jgi:PKD repeat protein